MSENNSEHSKQLPLNCALGVHNMERFEIVGILKAYGPETRFTGFYLKDVVGDVDPFVDGNFMPDCLKELLDSDANVIPGKEQEFIQRELDWAQQQVGKFLECDELYYRAFATKGEVRITP